jgi:hypothetical protein
MIGLKIPFDSADNPGRKILVEADPQAAVTPGPRPGTSTITLPDGQQFRVAGDYLNIHLRIQAVAARGHESGCAPRFNTAVS